MKKAFRVVSEKEYQECKGLGLVFVNDELYIDVFGGKTFRISLTDNLEPKLEEIDRIPRSRPMKLEDYRHIDEMKALAKENPCL